MVQSEPVKQRLIRATVKLLSDTGSASGITARQIAREAGANLAMINYYFGSKDALVTAAVSSLIAERAVALRAAGARSDDPQQRLHAFLTAMSDLTVEYAELTRPTVPWILLEGEFDAAYHLMPFVRECFGNHRTETECRIIAYQLISFSQLVFYRSADFQRYTGIEVDDKHQRDELFRTILDLYLPES